jgi:hypothetical protein
MRMFLIVLLFVVGVCGALMCGSIMAAAQSAVHEIEALIAGLISACSIGLACVALCVEKLREDTVAAINRGTSVGITQAKLAEVSK